MYKHIELGTDDAGRKRQLASLIRSGEITLGGYQKAKVYGLLRCSSGKRMNTGNRVFFKNEAEALANGYRPCGHCLPVKYKKWMQNNARNGFYKPQEPGKFDPTNRQL
jgi:methylphosphotriester-DNA--protein-cysteine methyltransferase